MLFHSLEFILGFLPLTFLAYVLCHRYWGPRAAMGLLAVASVVFYAQWSLAHAALLMGSASANFMFCRAMLANAEKPRTHKLIFLLAVFANLGLLGYLKYANFLIDNVNWLSGESFSHIHLLIPVGVSFFTFIQLGFLVEVYNRQVKEVKYLDYLLFGSFFAYVTAGPLVLQRDMLPQYADVSRRPFDMTRVVVALTVFGFGLFKKLALADSVAPFADAVFDGAAAGAVPSISLAWIGALAYTVQLYFDFSGYSDMALGIGLLFGLKLPFNFNSPLKATSITDFWRRWHMTMTRFFTSYLYAPLAVSNTRKALMRGYGAPRRFLATVAVPVFFTFVLAGIWHGAGWTFVIFGVIHGLAMAINHAWKQANMPALPDAVGWLLTMFVVIVGLVVFRAPDVPTALTILTAMIGNGSMEGGWTMAGAAVGIDYADAVGVVTLLFAIALMMPNTQQILYRHTISSDPADYEELSLSRWLQWRPSARWAFGCAGILALGLGLATGETAFIYYQF